MNTSDNQKRKHFRINLGENIRARAKILAINGKEVALDKFFNIKLLDLSAGGTRINSDLDLPIGNTIVKISFVFENEEYKLTGRLLRKFDSDGKQYGIQFLGLTEKEEQHLIRCLNDHQVRKVKVKERINLSKERDPVVKILQVLPFPAYLISREYTIKAANKLADQIGAATEEKCYVTICKRRTVCEHCQMSAAASTDEPVVQEVAIDGQEYLSHWLYLGKALYLYYFIEKQP